MRWLLFFYSLPAKPVAARMKVWRRLQKAGALHLKGSVYLLPHSEERQELLSWLVQEIEAQGGEADFVEADRTQLLAPADLEALFRQARTQAYRALEPEVEALERSMANPGAMAGGEGVRRIKAQLRRLKDQHQDIARVDFFPAPVGQALGRRLAALEHALPTLKAPGAQASPSRPTVPHRRREDFQGRLWVTRPRPFVDRMASAWLVRRCIDPAARFGFLAGPSDPLPAGAVGYDLPGGDFTHVGDWCTFEVLLRAFGLKDKALGRLAAIVHELDLHDGKHNPPQAKGAEEILRGVQRTAKDDQEALEKGMAVFDLLHASMD